MRALRFECGRRNVAGTDWPIVCTVTKGACAPRPWLFTFGICNGTAAGSYRCRTRRDAVRLATAYQEGAFEFDYAVDQLCRDPAGSPRCQRAS